MYAILLAVYFGVLIYIISSSSLTIIVMVPTMVPP